MAGLSPSRKVAFNIMCVARERDAYVRELLNAPAGIAALEKLSPEDRAFVRRLVLGVTATSGTLDEIIDTYAAKPDKLDACVRDALRLEAYEMLFLGKPAHVAVSQGVDLVRSKAKSAAGLANAVLRRVSENGEAFMAASDAHRFGLPQWLLDRVGRDLGQERARAFGQSCLEQAPVFVAAVPMWIDDEGAPKAFGEAGMPVRSYGAVPGAWRVIDPAKLTACRLVEQDHALVCDYGAQAVAFLAAPEPAERVLEVGSGRGTKTVLLAGHAHRAGGAARIWALDVHPYKASVARERLEKAGVDGVEQVTGDACDLDSLEGLPREFERILVDAPCSGTGTLRRHPEIAWSLTPEAVASCAELQLRLLKSVSARVAPAGELVYATCSVLRQEDEDVVGAFLASPEGAGFEVVPIREARGVASSRPLADEMAARMTPEGYLRTYPAPKECDGHFAAVLRRRA